MPLTKAAINVALLAALAACTPTVVVQTVCLGMVEYDQPFQTKLAAEIRAAPEGSALKQVAIDYHQMREENRACKGSK